MCGGEKVKLCQDGKVKAGALRWQGEEPSRLQVQEPVAVRAGIQQLSFSLQIKEVTW